MRDPAEVQDVFRGELQQLDTVLALGRQRYQFDVIGFRSRAKFIEQDRAALSRRWLAAGSSPAQREELVKEGARDVIVAYETMDVGPAPGWVLREAGIGSGNLGVTRTVPPVPVRPASAPPAAGNTYNVAGTASGSGTLNVPFGWLGLLLLGWGLEHLLDELSSGDHEREE